MKSDTTPRVYVGTYRAYNSGSLHGAWLDLEDYNDLDGFWEAVNELHAKEIAETGEIEPMFQDWEGIPDELISESHIDREIYEKWVDLDEDDRKLLEIYLEHVDQNGTLEQAKENYAGTFDSEADWAEEFLEDTGALSEVPESLRYYLDFRSYARDARLGGDVNFVEAEGDVWVFWNR